MKELFLLRGLPGSGKSTLADSIGGSWIEADTYHLDEEGKYDWKPENVKASHEWCQDCVENWMSWQVEHELEADSANRIVVSNTFTQAWEMQPYYDLAEKYGYRVYSLIVENRHSGINSHSIPQETLDKMKNRFECKL